MQPIITQPLRSFATAKGNVQSAFLMLTNPLRFELKTDDSFILSCHMLLGLAVELYLKAYLTHLNHDEKVLREHSVRHNLEKLLALCENHGFSLPEATSLVAYLSKNHGEHSYRYLKPNSEFTPRVLGTLFRELDKINAYVDEKIGASAAFDERVSSGGWVVPEQFDRWRL